MHSFFFSRGRRFLALTSLLAGFTLAVSAPAALAQASDATASLNTLAHRILNTEIQTNGLKAEGLKPWHLKVDLQLMPPGKTKPESATLEVWSLGTYQWKRVYTSKDRMYDGTELSVSRFEQYRSKPDENGFDPTTLNPIAARAVIDPLYLAGNILPNYELTVKGAPMDGLTLKCVLVPNPTAYDVDPANPDAQFPTVCFDSNMHLKALLGSNALVKYDDFQPFQGRSVARDVKLVAKGVQLAEAKVTLLEEWAGADAAQLKPGKGIVSEPYQIEPGMPQPVSVHEEGFPRPAKLTLGAREGGFYYTGMVSVPILIKKDGSVKVNAKGIMQEQPVQDAAEDAINRWKFKPYLVDGQPIEVGYTVHYNLDKPFVPSYNRPKAAPKP